VTSLIAGDEIDGDEDGIGRNAHFNGILGCASTTDGNTLFVTDYSNGALREVNTKSGQVITRVQNLPWNQWNGNQTVYPRKVTMYRSPNTEPDSVLCLTDVDGLYRYDIKTSIMSPITLKLHAPIMPHAIVCTPLGVLILSCTRTHSLYAVHPSIGELERVAGHPDGKSGYEDGMARQEARLHFVRDLYLSDDLERMWFVQDDRIRSVDLPPGLFRGMG
jgi:hypothetical protein